jgi:glycosyltransferase involved in cell wall biosynthesis
MMNARIALFYPWPNLDSVPSLCAAIEVLAQQGFHVDVFTLASQEFPSPTFHHERVSVFGTRALGDSPGVRQFPRSRYGPPVKLLLGPVKRLLKRLFFRDAELPMALLMQRHREILYKCLIGVDPNGLELAGRLSSRLGIPFVYWSLELLLSNELARTRREKHQWKRLKECEITLSQKAAVIIIQDEERAKLLADDNALPMHKFVFVPNAPLSSLSQFPGRSGYWHRQLDLPKEQHTVFHSGSLNYWTSITEIVRSVEGWPRDWILLVHTRFFSGQDPLLRKLQDIAFRGRVFFSTEPASRAEYPKLVAAADIGIAFYRPGPSVFTQENIRTIGFSSGKIAYYLQAGLPVIVNRWPSISRLVHNEGCGVVVDEPGEIGSAIMDISKRYGEYANNARKTFKRYLDPSRGLQELLKRIDRVSGGL